MRGAAGRGVGGEGRRARYPPLMQFFPRPVHLALGAELKPSLQNSELAISCLSVLCFGAESILSHHWRSYLLAGTPRTWFEAQR